MGNTVCTGAVRSVHEGISARPGSAASDLHDIKRDLTQANLGFLSGTDFGHRLAKVVRQEGLPTQKGQSETDASSYESMARMLIKLYDVSGDGYLQPTEVLSMITALCQVFLAFGNSNELVGNDFSKEERELAIAELSEDLLLMLYDEDEDGTVGPEERQEDGIGVRDLSRWLSRIEKHHLLGSLNAMTAIAPPAAQENVVPSTPLPSSFPASSAGGRPPAGSTTAKPVLASSSSFVGFPPARSAPSPARTSSVTGVASSAEPTPKYAVATPQRR